MRLPPGDYCNGWLGMGDDKILGGGSIQMGLHGDNVLRHGACLVLSCPLDMGGFWRSAAAPPPPPPPPGGGGGGGGGGGEKVTGFSIYRGPAMTQLTVINVREQRVEWLVTATFLISCCPRTAADTTIQSSINTITNFTLTCVNTTYNTRVRLRVALLGSRKTMCNTV